MVAEIAKDGIPKSLIAARDALAKLRAPRQPTEAEQKLDQILQDLKSKKGAAAQEAARRKLEQLRARLEALKLAAGSAAATGDARLARKVAKDIRDAARDLSRALADAGGPGGSAVVAAVPAVPAASAKPETAPQPAAAAPAGGSDLAALKSEAGGLLQELKKIMRKLRLTGLHPGIVPKDRAEMERMFAEADRQLAGLQAAAAPHAGMAVDVAV